MSSATSRNHRSSGLARRYRDALRRYLELGSAAGLQPALKLGREAVRLGVETLDLAAIHKQALAAQTLPIRSSTACDRIIKRARTFFAEAILPLEETHSAALEANAGLIALNLALNQRTVDLAASNKSLKREVTRRKVVEQTLYRSKEHAARLLEQSRRMQDQLRHLSRRVLSAQEEERKKISRELHDVIAQVLASINVRLAVLKTEATVNTRGLSKNIARTQRLVERSVDIVHRFAFNLRPAVLDHLGLIPALHSFMKSFMNETGIRVRLTASAGANKLDSTRRTVLYRVAQEALTNVARHARASRVEVNLRRLPKSVSMQIKDNGKSFDVERVLIEGRGRRMGLLGMRERVEMVGGTFKAESSPGKGTTIKAQIPFRNGVKEHSRP